MTITPTPFGTLKVQEYIDNSKGYSSFQDIYPRTTSNALVTINMEEIIQVYNHG